MENKKQSAQQVVGYIALGSETSREGATSGRISVTNYATLRAIEANSVVTDSPVIPSETFIGETRVVSVESAAQRQGKFSVQVPLLDTADLYFTVRTVPAFAVAVQQGRILLLDIADKDATSLALPDFSGQTKRQVNADLIGVIQVSGVYAISVFDATVRQNFRLGYQFGSVQPENFVERVNQSGVEQIVDFESWQQVAGARRAQYLEQKAADERESEELAEYEKDPNKGYRKAHEEAEERHRQMMKAAEPIPDITIQFSDLENVEIFKRALSLAGRGVDGLNYEIKPGVGYAIERTDVALAAIQKARAELKREDELAAKEEPEPVVQSAPECVVLRHERSES